MANVRPFTPSHKTDIEYHQFECDKCGETAVNTYIEPARTLMLERQLCWHCNYWREEEARLEKNHAHMTIIDGFVYGPGSRTSGSFRGMAGRRFDIEYIAPSAHAGKRITTFDLWAGSQLPAEIAARFPDTAKFLDGARKAEMSGEIRTCWNPSDGKSEPYPLPNTLDLR